MPTYRMTVPIVLSVSLTLESEDIETFQDKALTTILEFTEKAFASAEKMEVVNTEDNQKWTVKISC